MRFTITRLFFSMEKTFNNWHSLKIQRKIIRGQKWALPLKKAVMRIDKFNCFTKVV